ncbi:MAG: hypothetical protein HYZ34_14015, partial [Ignavibacteriae bacterium]|nr:hypothetical protein [Ignavibacteriota bacterium]
MKFLYSQWTPDSMTDEQRLQNLLSLFSYMVTKTSGDVEEALEWLRQIAREYGIFDENMSLEDLIEKLKELGLIEELDGSLQLTTRGIQRLRKDALDEIFSSLKKGMSGSHESPQTGDGVNRLSETKKWAFGDQPT